MIEDADRVEPRSPCAIVADDEAVMRQIIRALLETEACTVIEAESAREALDAVNDRDGDVDMLIADVMMPDMTGPEVATQIKASHPEIVVLFLTGYSPDVVPEQMRADPRVAVLEKPFETHEFIRTVRNLLSSPSAGRNAT